MNGEYDESPQIGYGSADDECGIAVFIRVCPVEKLKRTTGGETP